MPIPNNDGNQYHSDRLARLSIQALALLGGLAGVLIAAFHLLALQLGWSSHGLGGLGLLYQMGGTVFLLLAVAGTAGAALYRRSPKMAGMLLLFSGLLGFPVGYIAWINQGGFLGWSAWIPAGVLLTAAGILALVTPQALRTRLLGQEGDSLEREPIEQALFIGTILASIGVMTVIFLFSGLLINAAEAVSYTHLRAHETVLDIVCRLLLEKKKKKYRDDNLHTKQRITRAYKEIYYKTLTTGIL